MSVPVKLIATLSLICANYRGMMTMNLMKMSVFEEFIGGLGTGISIVTTKKGPTYLCCCGIITNPSNTSLFGIQQPKWKIRIRRPETNSKK
jgi:hypothetical protein